MSTATHAPRHAAPRPETFMSRHRRGVIITALVLVPMLVAGVAYAAWLVFANGGGYAKAGSAPVAPTIASITPVTLTEGAIMPGEQGALQVKIDNPNAFPLYLKSVNVTEGVSANASDVWVGTNPAGSLCPNNNWTLEDAYGISVLVAPGTSTVNVPDVVTLAAGAPIGCAGTVARFNVNGNDQGYTFDIAP